MGDGGEPLDPELEELARELRARAATALPGADLSLGPYELRLRLGRGGAGTVWEAWDTRLARRVAIKILHPHLALSAGQLDRFRREARLATAVDHPGLCRVHDIGEDHGLHFIVEELVDGGRTLAARIAELRRGVEPGDLSDWAAGLFREVAEAVSAVHAAGIAHRDLKPGNILIQRDGRPLVCDFGLAAVVHEDDLGVTTLQRGTAYYLAPEQVAGRPLAGHRGDVFSLGVALYETLALQRPFDGDTASLVGRRILEEEPVPLRRLRPGVPRDLETIVQRRLEKDPQRRYADAGELAEDLGRFLRREPVLARRPGPLLRFGRELRRRPVRAVFTAALVVAAVAVGLFTSEARRLNRLAEEEGQTLVESLDVLRGLVDYMGPDRVDERGTLSPAFLEKLETGARAGYADDPLELGRTLAVIAEFRDALGDSYRALELFEEAAELLEAGGAPAAERRELLLVRSDVFNREWLDTEALALLKPELEATDREADPVGYARLLLRALIQHQKRGDTDGVAELLEASGAVEEALVAARAPAALEGDRSESLLLDLEQQELFHLAYAGQWEAVGERAEEVFEHHARAFGDGDPRTVEMGVLLFTTWKVLLARTPDLDRESVHQRQEELTLRLLEGAEAMRGGETSTGLRALRLRAECLHGTRGALAAIDAYSKLVEGYSARIGPIAPRTLGVRCALAVMLIQIDPDRAFDIQDTTLRLSRPQLEPGELLDSTQLRAWMQAAERTGRAEQWLSGFLELAERPRARPSAISAWYEVLQESPLRVLRGSLAVDRDPGCDSGSRVAPELAMRCEEAWHDLACDYLAVPEPPSPPIAGLLADRGLSLAWFTWRRGERELALERLERVRQAAGWLEGEAPLAPLGQVARDWLLADGQPRGRAGELLLELAGAGVAVSEEDLAHPALLKAAAWALASGEEAAALSALAAVPAEELTTGYEIRDCCPIPARLSPCDSCSLSIAVHRLLRSEEVVALPRWRAHLEAIHGEHPGSCPAAPEPLTGG